MFIEILNNAFGGQINLIGEAGGLGSPALLYLAAAGVGRIGIADFDAVDISNLQRQILYSQQDLNMQKATAAASRLSELNSTIRIVQNILEIINDYDFIIDGTDSLKMKLLINDACIIGGKPFSHAGVLEFAGQIMTIIPHQSACLRCVFETPCDEELTCAQAGVIGAVVGVLGTLQALEAIKYLAGVGELLTNSFLSFQGDITRFHKLHVKRNEHCTVCGSEPSITKLNMEQYETCR